MYHLFKLGINFSYYVLVSLTDMKLDCMLDFVRLVWTESRSQADLSLFRLGNCYPTSFSAREAVFNVDINDCNFRRMVSSTVIPANSQSTIPTALATVVVFRRLLGIS